MDICTSWGGGFFYDYLNGIQEAIVRAVVEGSGCLSDLGSELYLLLRRKRFGGKYV